MNQQISGFCGCSCIDIFQNSLPDIIIDKLKKRGIKSLTIHDFIQNIELSENGEYIDYKITMNVEINELKDKLERILKTNLSILINET